MHFKKYNLDALFVVTNAPRRSAYNPVERRLASLGHATSGVILEHDHYGSHLNESGKTVDKNLEKRNFKFADETLSEIWSSIMIDDYPVHSEYVEPSETKNICVPEYSQAWFQNHVRTPQYLIQITKCAEEDCCGSHRSNVRDVLPLGFLPVPVKVKFSKEGKIVAANINDTNGKFLPLFQQLSCSFQPIHSGCKQVNSFIIYKVSIEYINLFLKILHIFPDTL